MHVWLINNKKKKKGKLGIIPNKEYIKRQVTRQSAYMKTSFWRHLKPLQTIQECLVFFFFFYSRRIISCVSLNFIVTRFTLMQFCVVMSFPFDLILCLQFPGATKFEPPPLSPSNLDTGFQIFRFKGKGKSTRKDECYIYKYR